MRRRSGCDSKRLDQVWVAQVRRSALGIRQDVEHCHLLCDLHLGPYLVYIPSSSPSPRPTSPPPVLPHARRIPHCLPSLVHSLYLGQSAQSYTCLVPTFPRVQFFSFHLFHLWSYDKFHCLKWRQSGRNPGAFKRFMSVRLSPSLPFLLTLLASTPT